MSLKAWQDMPLGGVNYDIGSSLKSRYEDLRRDLKPEFDAENCINCFFCWVFCPENAIISENEQVSGINYDYCKGCGICVHECPVQKEPAPLVMVREKPEI
jgi:pyruvate ferredoxin oxidoreductase delta subunit